MSDKYAEAGSALISLFKKSPFPPTLEEVVAFLRSAFPPPAEDAGECADAVYGILTGEDEGMSNPTTRHEVAAEIERFAESRVEPWREALIAYQKYCVCYRVGKIPSMKLCDQVEKANALLASSPAPDDILMSAVTGPISYPKHAPEAPK